MVGEAVDYDPVNENGHTIRVPSGLFEHECL
jgi:hypothetical protein